jgi:hypothetical protein
MSRPEWHSCARGYRYVLGSSFYGGVLIATPNRLPRYSIAPASQARRHFARRWLIMVSSQSPLKLRASFTRLWKCSRRRKLLLQLLYPIPWSFQVPPPSAPGRLIASTGTGPVVDASLVQRNIRQLHDVPLFRVRDTPLCSLYRLHEDLRCGNIIMMGYESSYFFYHSETTWLLSQVPDPEDADLVRYSLLASFVEALVAAFNWKLEQGLRRDGSQVLGVGDNDSVQPVLESPPSWTSKVNPVAERLDLRPPNNTDSPDIAFQRRNIEAPMGYLYSV